MRASWLWAVCAAIALGGMAAAAPANAVVFGPATTGFTFNARQTPSFTWETSTTVTLGGTLRTTTPTGTLAGVTSGASSGTFIYSTVAGTTLFESLPGLFTFNDPLGGVFTFNARSVETMWRTADPLQDSTSMSLTLLGDISGGSAGYSGVDATVLFNLSGFMTDTSRSNISATLSTRDASLFRTAAIVQNVPEPAGMAVFGMGMLCLAAVRRLRGAARRTPGERSLVAAMEPALG